ncbi:MAG: methyltransferase domain-containing protein [Candidatus Pacebacteria bacterium]|nr:methyltransferase domain-containing protein [Candidatus Paceibacterota bacterium]
MPNQADLIKTALAYEKKRQQLLKQGKIKAVLQTYQQQQVFLPDNNTGQFWDQYYADPNHQQEYPMESWKLNLVVKELDLDSSLLNIGVGDGKLEQRLINKLQPGQKLDYCGTDFTKKLLNQLKKRFSSLKFKYQKNLTKLSFKDHSFDQIVVLEVLEHIKPKQTFAVLHELYRILTPQGKLLLSVPVNEGLAAMLPANPNSHMRIYSQELLTFELEQAGFQVQKIYQASAFAKFFWLKHYLNQLFQFRQPNNLLVKATKL